MKGFSFPLLFFSCHFAFGQVRPGLTSNTSKDSTLSAYFESGKALFNEHDDTGEALLEAEKAFHQVLSIDSTFAPALAYLGLIALDRQKGGAADSLFRRALAVDSACAEAIAGKARLLRQQMKWEESYGELRRAVKLAPSSIFARWELASVLLHGAESPLTDERVTEAIPHLQKILEVDHNARQAHLDLAQSHERFQNWKDAARHYREVLRIGQIPEDMDVWVYEVHKDVARCFEKLGRYHEATEELRLYLKELKSLGADEETLKDVERKIQTLEGIKPR